MSIESIISGHENFKNKKFKKYKNYFYELVEKGQKPKVLFIGCSDSRVIPSLITDTDPGDMFIIRNVGNMVPPFYPDNDFHSAAAGIEYAVSILKVTDIIVCGHSHCGAIAGLYKKFDKEDQNLIHVQKWLELGKKAKDYVQISASKLDHEAKLVETEKISVVFQLLNLLTYPEIERRVEEGSLNLRGWYYKIESGELEFYDDESSSFKLLGA